MWRRKGALHAGRWKNITLKRYKNIRSNETGHAPTGAFAQAMQ
jgi:hypothetical protein